tara:strand:+ start:195 stop:371 length:177 start_codon:yes stop_codon:yes gene_type:complete
VELETKVVILLRKVMTVERPVLIIQLREAAEQDQLVKTQLEEIVVPQEMVEVVQAVQY